MSRQTLVMTEYVQGGHSGQNVTYNRLKGRWYWQGMWGDVKKWVSECTICPIAAPLQAHRAPMRSVPVPPMPFQKIAIDTLGPYNETARGNKYIHGAIEAMGKYPFALAVPTNDGVSQAHFLETDVIPATGIFDELCSDNVGGTTLPYNPSRLGTRSGCAILPEIILSCQPRVLIQSLVSLTTATFNSKIQTGLRYNVHLPRIVSSL
jgi:hypothetical protein